MVIIADSIGIKLLRPDYLLAGVGNQLHAYVLNKNSSSTIRRQIKVNFRSKIYAISSDDGTNGVKYIVFHGGREIAVAILNDNNEFRIIKRLALNDWISSVHLYKTVTNDEITFCALTAHNVALEIEVKHDGKWRIKNKQSCTDKCTLYCSLIVGNHWQNTTIFGGNAFGELIIWKIIDSMGPSEILHRLSGHNGVIFSINFSFSNNIITTTSDDRSVKIWDVTFESNEAKWQNSKIVSTKSFFGHTSRVFNHKIISYQEKMFIVTVGEDSITCIWSADGELVHKEFIATKVPLWNLDYDPKRLYIYACGSDGNIHQVNLKNILEGRHFVSGSLSMNGLIPSEYPIKLIIMQKVSILVIFSNRHNFYYTSINDEDTENGWKIFLEDINPSITLLETYQNFIAFAGYRFACIYKFENGAFSFVLNEKFSTRMIRCLKFLNNDEFVVCDDRGICTLSAVNKTVTESITFELPFCKERLITVAAKIENFLIIGDRSGNIHLFELLDEKPKCVELRHTLKQVNGRLGCTSFNLGPVNKFMTSGHDGKLKLIAIDCMKKQLKAQITYHIPMVWCDKMLEFDTKNCLLLAGFNDSHFIAWTNDNNFRFEYDCGGGHRYWDLFIDKLKLQANLIFIRNKKMRTVKFNLNDIKALPFHIPMNDWHSRPCNTIHIIKSTNNHTLMVSGGDDNLLKFNEIDVNSHNDEFMPGILLQTKFDIVSHISNIRTISSIPVTNRVFVDKWLVFSAGGRAQICVTEIEINEDQSLNCREVCDFMLRSTDLERKRSGNSQLMYIDPETRFMSLIALRLLEGHDITLFIGCSDGFLRQFRFSQESISFKSSVFYGRCILYIHNFEFKGENYLVSMATDGLIAFWLADNFNETSKPFFTYQHHGSGINSFDAFIDDFDRLYFATGGDDQTIVLSVLFLSKEDTNLKVEVEKSTKYPFNHTAQITGVQFCTESKSLYTIGVDQIVTLINLNDFSTKQIGYTCISDAKGLKIIDPHLALIFGCGLQKINL